MFVRALTTTVSLLCRLVLIALAVPLLLIGRLMGDKPAQNIDLSQPPTEADLAAWAHWLALHRPHRGELANIHAMDGYLCCVAVGPKMSMPNKWIGLMFEDQSLPQDVQPMLAVMARHMNDILKGCAQEPPQ
jgi:hypothetical protein